MIRIDGARRVILWGDDPDRIVLDSDGYVVSFSDEAAAREAAATRGWAVDERVPSTYELDQVERWCKSTSTAGDWNALLDAWNLLLDLDAGDSLFRAADRRMSGEGGTYDKLFRACNLRSMTPEGDHYIPTWNAGELAALRQLLLLGLTELRAHLRD